MSENESVLSELELTSAIEMLRAIIPDEELESLAPTGPAAVYTTSITIWMLILQRLGKGKSMSEVIKDVLANSRQLLPDNKRVREKTLSDNSGAYSRARKRLPLNVVDLCGFGIFSVAYGMTGEGHQILFRLTKSRFRSMRRAAQLLEETDSTKTYSLTWVPSAKDRKTNPDLPADASVDVFLHEVKLNTGETLYLVTTLGVSAEHAAEFYSRRYDVEHDIRDLKVTMSLETLRCRSVEMVKKEVFTSIVAYNLVIQFRRQAAEVAELPPRRLSFSHVWYTFRSSLLNKLPCSEPEWQLRYSEALQIASKDKLPNRPGRSYKRKAHPRRPKSTKFMKLENQKQEQTLPEKPPDKPK